MAQNTSANLYNGLKQRIFSTSRKDMETLALEIYRLQFAENKVYRDYATALGKKPEVVKTLTDIPFLPISFFKTHNVVCGDAKEHAAVFYSSTTTSGIPSKHIVRDAEFYTESFRKGFKLFYGDISEYCVLALLPSYLERKGSSLVYMAEDLIKQSNSPHSGFYLHNLKELGQKLEILEKEKQKTLLLGVTYALLDLAQEHPIQLRNTVVMETGGMKGKRKEMPRAEVHAVLKKAFGVDKIHSEYGMTELLSQGYSKGDGLFHCPPWMRILKREMYDPLQVKTEGKGAINVVDLANLYSCSFIATDDAGVVHSDGSFEISGRLDNSDIRGCNLMAEEL